MLITVIEKRCTARINCGNLFSNLNVVIMKKALLFLLACAGAFSAGAYRIEWGRSVTITQPVHEDLYVAGGTVTVNAPIYGDLIVAGGTININDTVMNDLLVAGGTVTINGYVADDIRCAGGELHVLKNIGGDLVVTGGKVDIANDVAIAGGLMTGGGEVTANGTVNGDVRCAAGNLVFNGTAAKNFDCRSESLTINGTVMGTAVLAARQINVGTAASFHNNVRYWNREGKLDFGQSLNGTTAEYDASLAIKPNAWYYLGHATLLGLVWYLSTVFIFLMLIEYLFRNTFQRAGNSLDHSLLKSLGYGFLFFIGVPLAVGLLLITVIGIPVGVLLMLSYITLVLLATVITSLVTANWYNHRFEHDWTYWQTVWAAFAVFVLFKMISLTPFWGWLIMILIACIAFGALLRTVNWRKKAQVAID